MISYICTREMRRILRNCKASAFVLKILLILLTVRGAEQGQSTSSSHTSRSESGGTTSEGSSTDLAVTYHQSTSVSSTSRSAESEDATSDSSIDLSHEIVSECGYSSLASFTLTDEANRLLHAEKIETKIAKGYYSDASDSSESHDSSSICFPKDPNAKPSDEPEMHCYTLGQGKWPHRNVTYAIRSYSNKLNRGQVDNVIARAFKAWSDVSPLSFRKNDARADINISFKTNIASHVLGQTHYPRNGGCVQFNDKINWTIDSTSGYNLRQVATHEIGHALGLGHSNLRAAVMYPSYPPGCSPYFTIDRDDIAGIQALYGRPTSSPATPRGTPTAPRGRPSAPGGTPTAPRGTPTAPRGRLAPRGRPIAPGGRRRSIPRRNPNPRTWCKTSAGHVYWPPVRKGNLETTYVWNEGKTTRYYYSGQGWFPYR